jgi:hypothetical protein
MQKLTLFISCLLLQFGASAQKKTTYVIHPYVGYETNVLRSPSSSTSDSSTLSRSELWKNAPFAAMDFSVVRKMSEQHKFGVYTTFKRSFLTQNIGLNASDMKLRLSHQYTGKRLKNTVDLRVRNLVQSGNNDFRDILGAPLTYKRLAFFNKTDVKLSKPWHLVVQPFAEIKFYDRADFDRFSYHDLGVRLQGNYQYSYRRKVGLRFIGEFHQRNYLIRRSVEGANPDTSEEEEEEEFEEGEFEEEQETDEFEEIDERERKWNYQKVGFEMRFPKKRYVLTTGLNYTLRTDLTEDRFGYHQLEWGFGYQLKLKSTKIGFNNSVIARLYPNLTSGSNQLVYVYLKPELTLRQTLSKRVDFVLNASLKYRYSSLDNPAKRAMRTYLTTGCSAGFIFKIERKEKKYRY